MKQLFLQTPFSHLNSDKWWFRFYQVPASTVNLGNLLSFGSLRLSESPFLDFMMGKDLGFLAKFISTVPLGPTFNGKSVWCNELTVDDVMQYITNVCSTTPPQFDELLQDRISHLIEDIWNESDNIILPLSGGIDSTCVFYAIVDHPDFQKISHKFKVLWNEEGLKKEYPYLIEVLENRNITNEFVPYKDFIPALAKHYPNSIFVSPEGGDQLGCTDVQHHPIFQILPEDTSVIDGIEQIYQTLDIPDWLHMMVNMFPHLSYIQLARLCTLMFKQGFRLRIPAIQAKIAGVESVNINKWFNVFGDIRFHAFTYQFYLQNPIGYGTKCRKFMRDYVLYHNDDKNYYNIYSKTGAGLLTNCTEGIMNTGYIDKDGYVHIISDSKDSFTQFKAIMSHL